MARSPPGEADHSAGELDQQSRIDVSSYLLGRVAVIRVVDDRLQECGFRDPLKPQTLCLAYFQPRDVGCSRSWMTYRGSRDCACLLQRALPRLTHSSCSTQAALRLATVQLFPTRPFLRRYVSADMRNYAVLSILKSASQHWRASATRHVRGTVCPHLVTWLRPPAATYA